MTAEICMMNRLAVVLAADSATTVSRWVNGEREERYFKGANKVFQLSDMQPVGLMIFDSADILNVPWEVIVKSFRSSIKGKCFNTVDEYARELFAFLSDHPRFFPEDIQDEEIIRAAVGAAITWITSAVKDVDEAGRATAIETAFGQNRAELDLLDVPETLGQDSFEKVVDHLRERIAAILKDIFSGFGIDDPAKLDNAVETSLHEVIKSPENYLNSTGLVFAGFGDHEIFPSMVEYLSCGIVDGKHIYSRQGETKIDHHKPAWLKAFAQTSMIDTFSAGFSSDVYSSIMLAVRENLRIFAEEVAQKSGGQIATIDDVDSLVQAARKKIGEDILDNARKEHSLPLRSVLGVLPANEMAELAETLITLQSLKEKVTKPSETVGGPVDVAIITKHEGLVWVKRKHFFDPELNSRFKLRQVAQHG